MVFRPPAPAPGFCWCVALSHGMPTRVGNKQRPGTGAGCAQDCAAARGARAAPGVRWLLLRCPRAGGGWCPSGQCSGGVLPQRSIAPNAALTRGYSALLREKGANPKKRRHERNPGTPDLPPEPEPGPPAPGRAERAAGSREGEETRPREHVKSLRRGRWKITLAPSRPVLLCAARRAIFLRS